MGPIYVNDPQLDFRDAPNVVNGTKPLAAGAGWFVGVVLKILKYDLVGEGPNSVCSDWRTRSVPVGGEKTP